MTQENAIAVQVSQLSQVDAVGQTDRRETLAHGSHDGHAVRGRVGGRGHDDQQHDRDDRAGDLRREPLEGHDDDQGGRRERQRRRAGVAEGREQVPLLLQPAAGPFGDPQHVRELAGGHLHPDAGEEPDEHRRGQEVAQEPEPEDPREDQQHAADQRDEAGVGDPLLRVRCDPGDGCRAEPRGQDRRGRGVGTHHQQP